MAADYRGAVEDGKKYEEGLVQRCADCDWCFFEHTLTLDQRKRENLLREMPEEPYISIERLEQLCGKNHLGKCEMKELVLRLPLSERAISQNKDAEIYKWDLGARTFNFTGAEWTRKRDMGRGFLESPAERFDEIWGLGIHAYEDGTQRQTLSPEQVYDYVMAEGDHYNHHLQSLRELRIDHDNRIARRKTSPLAQVTN